MLKNSDRENVVTCRTMQNVIRSKTIAQTEIVGELFEIGFPYRASTPGTAERRKSIRRTRSHCSSISADSALRVAFRVATHAKRLFPGAPGRFRKCYRGIDERCPKPCHNLSSVHSFVILCCNPLMMNIARFGTFNGTANQSEHFWRRMRSASKMLTSDRL